MHITRLDPQICSLAPQICSLAPIDPLRTLVVLDLRRDGSTRRYTPSEGWWAVCDQTQRPDQDSRRLTHHQEEPAETHVHEAPGWHQTFAIEPAPGQAD